jgi:hypothetical protein
MVKLIAPVFAVMSIVMFVVAGSSLVTASTDDLHPDALTVHEWGTFTTVAGVDGKPVDWLPLAGPNDLPCFVEHFGNNPFLKVAPASGPVMSYAEASVRLKGKVRMETPVLYFYSPREENLHVKVKFEGGLISEWYPNASVSQMAVREKLTDGAAGQIEWNNVLVSPGAKPDFPSEGRASHYYAARQTDSSPVSVNGKKEKFLFYRGLGSFDVPLTAEALPSGQIVVNTGEGLSGPIIRFDNRDGKIGYLMMKGWKGDRVIGTPRLGDDFEALRSNLEQSLVASGLYPKEAHAMVETWRDSWFEEGTRIFYLVRKSAVDRILPLEISPAPAQTARTFVGRMEVIMPDMVKAAENETATLQKYGRFMGPIVQRFPHSAQLDALVDSTYKAYLNQISSSCK